MVSLLALPLVLASLCMLHFGLNPRTGWILAGCTPFLAAALALRASGLLACLPPVGDFDGGGRCRGYDFDALRHALSRHAWLADFMAARGVAGNDIKSLRRGAVRWLVGSAAFFDERAAMAAKPWALAEVWRAVRQHRAAERARGRVVRRAQAERQASRAAEANAAADRVVQQCSAMAAQRRLMTQAAGHRATAPRRRA